MNSDIKAFLNIIDGQGEIHRICLDDQGKTDLTFGTDKDNDIVLPKRDNYVSRHHGVIRIQNGKFYYRDTNNTNGSYIIAPSFSGFVKSPGYDIEIDDNAVIKIGNMQKSDRMTVLWLNHLRAGEKLEMIRLDGRNISIGRDAANDIVLDNPYISKVHAVIGIGARGYYEIRDNSIRSGIMVNGLPAGDRADLYDKDVIQILGYQLIYSGNIIYYKRTASGIAIRAAAVSKTVDKGKLILNNVSLEIKANEFVAIIGGSGAGKSTLMGVLNGFDRNHTGEIYYNNINLNRNFGSIKDVIGYVPQEDIVYENLTLREMLRYSAELRMPADQTDNEIEHRIDEVLATLDLSEHQNTYIRKMSGGQKKRASIAVELLADPKVFFLDEPTSGLDPGTEKNLMIAMSRLSKEQDRTIVMVTHTTQSLHLCDKIIFMGPGGLLCFMGNVEEAKQFFETDDLTEIYNMIAADPIRWANAYLSRNPAGFTSGSSAKDQQVAEKKNKVSGLYQFGVVTERYAKLCLNDWRKMMIQLATPVIMGIIIWFIADENFLRTYSGTKSILFTMSCAAIWIGLFAAIQEVCKERSILKREYMASLRLRSYVFAKFFVILVQSVLQAALLTLTGFMTLSMKYSGDDDIKLKAANTLLGEDRGITWEVYVTLLITMLASAALGLLISSFFKNSDKATTIAPFVLIIQLVFSGMLFQLEGAKETISYITFSRWSVDALGRIVNLRLLEGYVEGMDENMFEWASDKLIQDWWIMMLMALLCLIASMIVLRRISKDGR